MQPVLQRRPGGAARRRSARADSRQQCVLVLDAERYDIDAAEPGLEHNLLHKYLNVFTFQLIVDFLC